MHVLITGAAGFVGSHLVDRYLNDGATVTGIDNLLTGNIANLAAAHSRAEFSFVNADVAGDWSPVDALLESSYSRPELVLHFASPASPADYALFSLETLAANAWGTQNCCALAARLGARLVYASTSEVYGEPLNHPQAETYWGNVNPVGPRSCYDESKRFGEAMVCAYARCKDLDVRIVRIFNTYGPRMRRDDGRVIPNFISQALAGKALTLYGSGQQTRSFCYVDDLVEGIVRLARADVPSATIVNLGNPVERTVLELARSVAKLIGVALNVEHRALPVDDPSRRCPDITRARRLLQWEPQVELEEGLQRTIASFMADGRIAQR